MPELPDNNYDEARRWLKNVEDDLHAMRAVVRDPESLRRMVPWAVDGRYADDLAEAGAELASRLAGFAEQVVRAVRRELGAERRGL